MTNDLQHHIRLHITINQNHDHDHHNEVDLYQIDELQDFDLSGFSKLTKEQVLQLRGLHLRTKAPYTVATPSKIILKSVLNFVYNFVIFLLFFLESTFLLFL